MESNNNLNLLIQHAQHAAILGIGLATFRRHIPDLLARGYPARRIGEHLIADREAVLAWLRQGDGQDTRRAAAPASPPAPVIAAPAPVKRGPGRPRKCQSRAEAQIK